jgi:lipid-A-disaccharide synthase
VIPAPTLRIRDYLYNALADLDFPATIVTGHSRQVIAAADIVLLASGTATLETLLLRRPMVVAYQVAPLTAWIAGHLVKVPYFALPNLLAGKQLVPEFFQQQATPQALQQALQMILHDTDYRIRLQDEFAAIHRRLRLDASTQAAEAIVGLLTKTR